MEPSKFNLTGLNNPNKNILEIIKESESIKKGKQLSNKEIIKLGEALSTIQNKSILDKCLGVLSQITPETRMKYLSNLVENYIIYLDKIKGTDTDDRLNQAISSRKKQLLEKVQSDLHLSPLSDQNMMALYEEKRRFMTTQMNLFHSDTEKIVIQIGHFPIIQAAVREIAETYEKWDNSSTQAEKEQLQYKLKLQHQNLVTLSQMIDETENNDENTYALTQLTFLTEMSHDPGRESSSTSDNQSNIKKEIGAAGSFANILGPYIRGEAALDVEMAEEIKSLLNIEVKKINHGHSLLHESKEELKKKRAAEPTTKSFIEKTADLLKMIRHIKTTTALLLPKYIDLISNRRNVNIVIPIKDKASSDNPKENVIAYYKEGAGNEKAVGIMEKLIWDIAGILQTENNFAPTAKIALKSVYKEENTTDALDISSEEKSSIQIPLEGITLEDYIYYPTKRQAIVEQGQLIRGTILTLIFGMFDAHHGNIIVDSATGELKFFDNTRSLPTSNGILRWRLGILPSYRSGLLELDGCYKTLNGYEREYLGAEIQKYQMKIKYIQEFLSRSDIKNLIESLPAGWFNTEESLSALQERMNRMADAMKNQNIKNLRDLVFAVNPDFKYCAALESFRFALENKFMSEISSTGIQKRGFAEAGKNSLDMLVEKVAEQSVDPEKILLWCQNPALTFEDILKNISKEYFDKSKSYNPAEKEKCRQNAERIINDYKSGAKIDFKDISRDNIRYYAIEMAVESLKKGGLSILEVELINTSGDIKALFEGDSTKKFVILREDIRNLSLYYIDNERILQKSPIDCMSKLGSLKIDNCYLTPEEIKIKYGS